MSKFCGHCHQALNPGARFCGHCGQPVATEPPTPAPTSSTDVAPGPAAAPAGAPTGTPAATPPAGPGGSESALPGVEDATATAQVPRVEPGPRTDLNPAASDAAAPAGPTVTRQLPPLPPLQQTPPSPPAPGASAAAPGAPGGAAPTPPPAAPGTGPHAAAGAAPHPAADPAGPAPVSLPALPFGLAWGDVLRDVAVLLLGAFALGTGWDAYTVGGDNWWVLVPVLLTWASVGVPYLGRFGVVKGLSPQVSFPVKAAMNVPSLFAVLAVYLFEVLEVFADFRDGGLVGTGVVMLTAAVALAVQPRLGEDRPGRHDARWRVAAAVLFLLAALGAVSGWLMWLLQDNNLLGGALRLTGIGAPGVGHLLPWLVLLTATGQLLLSRPTSVVLAVAATIGLGHAVVVVLTTVGLDLGIGSGGLDLASTTPYAPLAVLAGALAVSRPALRSVASAPTVSPASGSASSPTSGPARGTSGWYVEVARLLTRLAALTAAVQVPGLVVDVVARSGGRVTGAVLAMAVLACAVLIAVAGSSLPTDPAAGGGRSSAVLLLSFALLLALVVIAAADTGYIFSRTWMLQFHGALALLVAPGVALLALTVPAEVRRDLGPVNTSALSREETAHQWSAAAGQAGSGQAGSGWGVPPTATGPVSPASGGAPAQQQAQPPVQQPGQQSGGTTGWTYPPAGSGQAGAPPEAPGGQPQG